MDYERISQLMEEITTSALKQSQDYVTQGLASGLDWDDGWEKPLSLAVFNAVKVSVRLSIQLVFTMLIQENILELKQDDQHPQLTVIRGGANLEQLQKPPEK